MSKIKDAYSVSEYCTIVSPSVVTLTYSEDGPSPTDVEAKMLQLYVVNGA